jgi:TPR repeat
LPLPVNPKTGTQKCDRFHIVARALPTDLLGMMLDRAIQGYDQAIQLDKKNAVAYVSRGLAYAIKGDYDRAK